MEAVILAAGWGQRLRPYTQKVPKPLVKVAGRELLFRHLYLLSRCGVKKFVIVINARHEAYYRSFLARYPEFSCELVLNPQPEKGNGYSFWLSREKVSGPFVLTMADHVYEPAFVKEAIRRRGLIVDEEGRFIDQQEATKALCDAGRIKSLGKGLSHFSGFDTGFFVLTPEIYEAAQRLVEEKEKLSLSQIMVEAQIPCSFLSGLFWTDIDTPEDLLRARRFLIRQSLKGSSDGWVSRLLNRRLSTWFSERLVDHLSPNQATVLTTFLGFLASFFLFWKPWLGAVFYQLSSALDGMDGEIARASLRVSAFGGWLDSVLDRMVDFVFLWALALVFSPPDLFWWGVFLWAVFGSLMVSYVSERFRGAFGEDLSALVPQLRWFPGKRDERVFLILVAVLLGWIKGLYLLLALLTNLRVLVMIYSVWRLKGRREARPSPQALFGPEPGETQGPKGFLGLVPPRNPRG